MPEILREAIAIHNLPVTVFLGVILLYWLFVMVGFLEADMDGMDLHAGDVHAGDLHHDVHVGASEGGFWVGCGRFLHLGEVPLMIMMSFLALFMWVISVLANYYLNGSPGDRSPGLALVLLVPNFLVSLLLTRVAVSPLRKVFAAMHKTETEAEKVIGREGRVISAQVDDRYGQVEIITKSAPLLVNARTAPHGSPIAKGTQVIVFSAAEDHSFYLVKPLSETSAQSAQC